MLQSKTTPGNKAWNENLRFRVGDSISYSGKTWSNITGFNSEPGVGFDWELIKVENAVSKPNIERFVAAHNQNSFIVGSGSVLDDGLWTVQAGSVLLNSTTGITSFINGAITINFATGEITFLNPLQGGTQVIIKHN